MRWSERFVRAWMTACVIGSGIFFVGEFLRDFVPDDIRFIILTFAGGFCVALYFVPPGDALRNLAARLQWWWWTRRRDW